MKQNPAVHDVTILLTLWDRSEYTQTWIEKNLCENFQFIVADGSFDSENERIFSKYSDKTNLKYMRFQPDTNIQMYLKKVNKAVKACKTEYILMMDNDDFLHSKTVIKMKNKLEKYKECGLCAGTIRYISETKSSKLSGNPSAKRYRISYSKDIQFGLDRKSDFAALKHALKPYLCVWYSLFRTSHFSKIWSLAEKKKINDLFILEYFVSHLSLAKTTVCAVPNTFLFRLTNPTTNTAQTYARIDFNQKQRILFDEEYRKDFFKLFDIICDGEVSRKNELQEIYREFFFDFSYGKSFGKFAIGIALSKLYNYANFFAYKIETMIKMVAFIEGDNSNRIK
tara:strand:- start:626 stop:1642 length:1017 start_codon:yes stop_codon:yes gene_type:complete